MSTKAIIIKIPLSLSTICCFLYFLLFFPLNILSANNNVSQFEAIVTKIIDGDTFEIAFSGGGETIRLWGIDTPEWDQPHSKEAKTFLKNTILRNRIIVQPRYYDEYGRLIATIIFDEEIFNQLLVENGLAWVHIYYCNSEICRSWKQLEKIARSKNRGLWRQPHPIPPWQWKQKN